MQASDESIQLTTRKKDLALIIDRHCAREVTRAMPRYTLYKLFSYYLQGYRRFEVFNPQTGNVQPYITDKDGQLGFQSSQMLVSINDVADNLAEMDVRPSIGRPDDSLASIRDRSVMQIVCDAITDESTLNVAKADFMYTLANLGMCGLTGDINKSPTLGLSASFSAIHPRELFPFPSLGDDYTSEQGIIRRRLIPLDILADKLGSKVKSNAAMAQMEWYEIETGEAFYDPFSFGENEGGTFQTMHNAFATGMASEEMQGGRSKKATSTAVVRVNELWMHGERNTTKRFVSTSGEFLFEDADYKGSERPCPIGIARFFNNGSWHGAGMAHVLFSMHREMEKLLRDLFQNIHDIDKYGTIILPAGEFNERNLLRQIPGGPKAISYRQDSSYDQSQFRPFHIEPFTAGEIPGKTALLAQGMVQQLNPITDLAGDKGRVDGAPGLRMLEEEGRKKLRRPLQSAANAFGVVHKFVGGKALFESMSESQPFPVGRLDTKMAGAIIDFEKESISFDENSVPKIHQLAFTVRDEAPRNREAKKQAAFAVAKDYFAEGGEIDTDGLKLYLISEGLEVEAWIEEEKNAYEVIVRNILKMFGDGDENTDVEINPFFSKPALQLRVLNAFMSSVVFERAGVQVKNDFIEYKQELTSYMGNVLPSSMKNADDYVANIAMQQLQGGMDPMSGGPTIPQSLPFPKAQ